MNRLDRMKNKGLIQEYNIKIINNRLLLRMENGNR